jgi:hypothetical protein
MKSTGKLKLRQKALGGNRTTRSGDRTSSKLMIAATKRRNANKKRSAVKFDKGDYVLVAVAEPQNLSKLQPRWNGPYQITDVVSDWVWVVKHLVSKVEKTVHAFRLQFYSDKDFNVTNSTTSGSKLLNPSKIFEKKGKNTKS